MMSQRPAMRHVLAHVRLACGFSQVDTAKLLGCSAVTVRRIEQANLGLSEKLALRAQKLFNVSAAWLFLNDPDQPLVTPAGEIWSADKCEISLPSTKEKRREAVLARLIAADQAFITPPH